MIIASFIVQYFVMSLIMSNSIQNITNSMGKLYISFIMAFIMGILEVVMHDFSHGSIHVKYYIPLFALLFVFLVLYRKQVGIDDKQYVNEMIEHHSMAILTSDEILNKSNNYQVRKLASQIIETQKAEIQQMKDIINAPETKI